MITHGEDVEIHALRKQGWSISAIARHMGLDRKTVRAYLCGDREVGVRRGSAADPFDAVAAYVCQRLAEDPHVRATVLSGEVRALGYGASYPTFVRRIRDRGLRPECRSCSPGGPMSTSSTCRARRSSGTGWSRARRRGGLERSCWWGCCLTRAGCAAGSRSRWTRLIWSRVSIRCCRAWAAPPGAGEPTAWRRWSLRARTATSARQSGNHASASRANSR